MRAVVTRRPPADRTARESRCPQPASSRHRRARASGRPAPAPGIAAAGDLPENYVPRHSVQTPGPAAEPAAPISGPIPIVRPATGDADEAPSRTRARPSAARRCRRRGCRCRSASSAAVPALPLQAGGAAAGPVVTAGRLDRPGPARPAARRAAREARRLRRRCRRGAFRPPRRRVRRPRPRRPPRSRRGADTGPAEIRRRRGRRDDVVVTAGAGLVQPVDYADYDDYDDDDDADDDGDRRRHRRRRPTGPPRRRRRPGRPSTSAPSTRLPTPPTRPGRDLAEAATTVLPVVHAGTPPPARMVGIPVQRAPVHTGTSRPGR